MGAAGRNIAVGVIAIPFSLLLLSGCDSGTSTEDAIIERSQFKTLSLAYLGYVSTNKGKIPGSSDEFKKYVEEGIGGKLRDMNLTVEEIFISPRDGKPFVFVYQDNQTEANKRVIGYEQEGAGGRRYLSDRSGAVMDVNDSEFQRIVSKGG